MCIRDRFNTEDSQFRIFAPEDNQSYTTFCITRENSIWIGSSDGLISLLNPEDETMESYNVFAHSSPNTPRKLSMLYPSPTTDRIYIAFEHDDVKTVSYTHLPNGIYSEEGRHSASVCAVLTNGRPANGFRAAARRSTAGSSVSAVR